MNCYTRRYGKFGRGKRRWKWKENGKI